MKRDDFLKRMRLYGIEYSVAGSVYDEIQKWIESSGVEQTIARLKFLRHMLLRHYAGLPPEKEAKAKVWVKKADDGLPKGPFRVFFKLPRTSFWKAWNGLYVHSMFVYSPKGKLKVTRRQIEKFLTAVYSTGPKDLHRGYDLVMKSPVEISGDFQATTGVPVLFEPVSPKKKAATSRITRKILDEAKVRPEVETLVTTFWDALLATPLFYVKYSELYAGALTGLESMVEYTFHRTDRRVVLPAKINFVVRDQQTLWEKTTSRLKSGAYHQDELIPQMGRLSFLQEAGYKLRTVANPHRLHQAVGRPLGQFLYKQLGRIPQDFTYDQEGGISKVQYWLQQGLVAYSMDLANATDRIPLNDQLDLLRKGNHIPSIWIEWLEACCKGKWEVEWSQIPVKRPSRSMYLTWQHGQPLGLYPSFAMFALWHHAFVQALFLEAGWTSDPQTFPYCIVGDDVVIFDGKVASLYVEACDQLGIEVSKDKSFTSDVVAEFLGRVITRESVTQGFKWKGRATDESFMDFCKNLGPRSKSLLRPRQRRVLDIIAPVPEPIGLGWNPKGLPMAERSAAFLDEFLMLEEEDERIRSFQTKASRLNSIFASVNPEGSVWGTMPDSEKIIPETVISDQDMVSWTRAVLPGFSPDVFWWSTAFLLHSKERDGKLTTSEIALLKQHSSVESRKDVPTLVRLERLLRRKGLLDIR